MSKTYYYVRVSSADQNEDRQLKAIEGTSISISSRERISIGRTIRQW